MPKTILLTGAMGFVGQNLLRYARAQDSQDQWIAVDFVQDETLKPNERPEQYSFHALDLGNQRAVESFLQTNTPDVVLHFAGCISKGSDPDNRTRLFRSNVETTWNLLSALPRPAYFMLTSTGMIYGSQRGPFAESMEVQPSDDYSHCKHLAEIMVQAFAKQGRIQATILRPAVLYGLGQKGDMFIPSLCCALQGGTRFSMTKGEQTRDFVHVRDLCSAVFSLLKKETTGTFNIGTGTSVSMRDVAENSATILGQKELLGIGDVAYRKQEIWDYRLSSTLLQQATGWIPKIPLTQGIQEILQEKQS